MSKSLQKPRRKLCLGCGYVLDGLKDHICPECGREFDAKNGKTFRWDPPLQTVNNASLVAAIYLIPHMILFLYFLPLAQSELGWELVIALWMVFSSGPAAIYTSNLTGLNPVILHFVLQWSAILSLMVGTRLRNLSYGWHVLISIFWPISGWVMFIVAK